LNGKAKRKVNRRGGRDAARGTRAVAPAQTATPEHLSVLQVFIDINILFRSCHFAGDEVDGLIIESAHA
jgi:hypothetical protein